MRDAMLWNTQYMLCMCIFYELLKLIKNTNKNNNIERYIKILSLYEHYNMQLEWEYMLGN